MLQLPDTRAAYRVASTAARHAATKPLRHVLLRDSACVAHATYERWLRWQAAAVGKGDKRMAFGTLRRVVHHLGANAAVLVKPLRGEVDGARR